MEKDDIIKRLETRRSRFPASAPEFQSHYDDISDAITALKDRDAEIEKLGKSLIEQSLRAPWQRIQNFKDEESSGFWDICYRDHLGHMQLSQNHWFNSVDNKTFVNERGFRHNIKCVMFFTPSITMPEISIRQTS